MTIPVVKRFKKGDRVYVQAQRIWLILVAFVMNNNDPRLGPPRPRTITYSDLALLMGYPDPRAGHTLGRSLGIVGALCVGNGLPALNVIVVGRVTGAPGYEVVLSDGKTVGQEQREVMAFDWYTLRVPTTGTFRQVWDGLSGRTDDSEDE